MNFRIVRVSRRPSWPLAAVIALVIWAGLGYSTIYVAHATGQNVTLCLFRHLTSLPCPTCGCTRGLIHLSRGHVLAAYQSNPLLFCLGAACFAALSLRLAFARKIDPGLTRNGRRLAYCLFVGLVLANWVYVVLRYS